MQKLLRVFISLILLQGVCQAHEINPDNTEMVSNKAYEEYFKDYTQRLYENYKPEKHFLKGWSQGDEFMYIIRRDGTVALITFSPYLSNLSFLKNGIKFSIVPSRRITYKKLFP